ncbi:hypothetical protein D3C80_2152260 [compost metagenome]
MRIAKLVRLRKKMPPTMPTSSIRCRLLAWPVNSQRISSTLKNTISTISSRYLGSTPQATTPDAPSSSTSSACRNR